MPHIARALAIPAVRDIAVGVARYADIVYQAMPIAARLTCIPGCRPVLYISEHATLEDQARAFTEARLALMFAPEVARSARPVARLRLVS